MANDEDASEASARGSASRRSGDDSVARLASVGWDALDGLAPSLEEPLRDILGGRAVERVLWRLLRSHRGFSAAQRAAVSEALFGVGLWRRRLAFQLGWGDDEGPALAGRCAAAPRLLLAALLRDLAAVDRAEALAGVPAGSLPPPRPPPVDLARRFSLPDWLAAILEREVGDEAAALADALGVPGPVCLRVNTARASREAVAARLAAEGVRTAPGAHAPAALVVTSPRPNVHGLGAWREGLFEVQDEGSQLVALLAGAVAGDEVLDLCAGAGGKTLALAAAVGPAGRAHATDPDAERLVRLRARAARAGAGNVVVHGPAPPPGLVVDRALVDAPCSELGPFRRGPDRRFNVDTGHFAALPPLQSALLDLAARHLRPGGRLAYATCTFRREENEEVALAFERRHPDFRRVDPAAPPAFVGGDRFFRAWPHRHGTDGFFGAVWERAGAPRPATRRA